MEIENEIIENNDITATQLYEKLESWNKDVKKLIKYLVKQS